MKTVCRIALLSLICISLLTQKTLSLDRGSDQNAHYDLYEPSAIRSGATFSTGFSALVATTESTILSTLATARRNFEGNVKALARGSQPG